jgi:hypothetical protein
MKRQARDSALAWLLALRWRPWTSIAFCGLMGVLVPAAYGIATGIHEPWVHDEFSYLLAADTFARGRMTNPAPPLPEFFESPHILVVPSYTSKYPPGQGLVLAAGLALTGRPIAGVWLGCGLFASCLCWMLQAWSSRRWALTVTLLMVVTLGMSSYWAQSYWGGMVAASGGALLFGGLRRVLRAPQLGPSVLMALGVLILANTRPYEGVLVTTFSGLVLGVWFVRDRQSNHFARLKLCVIPACVVLACGALLMAFYNRAVTGSAATTPYTIHTQQYFSRGPFVFSSAQMPAREPVERVKNYYRDETASEVETRSIARIAPNTAEQFLGSARTTFGIAMGRPRLQYAGVFIGLALLTAIWFLRSTAVILLGALGAGLLEAVMSWYAPAHIGVLGFLVLTAWMITFCATALRQQWTWVTIAGPFVAALGGSLVWWWWPHYSAPVTPLLLAALAITCQSVERRTAAVSLRRVGLVLSILLAVHSLRIAVVHGFPETAAAESRTPPVKRRSDILRRLHRQEGQHLVFVRYHDSISPNEEWVYNTGDLPTARVIFAHDLGARNPELMAAFADRSCWLLSISPGNVRLEVYPQRDGSARHSNQGTSRE